ncbi:acetyl-CoA carboxylase biotin carboxyl carrier protein subunit [Gracilimonas mengyeensis]|uniref:Biotin-requiring enzyme n=1 Tax=Gracilimonas mengyeensis TaxID=1302730 RepID=A0A521D6B8_9BACT|nr:acetyl-CoA carboxylase biotin carboxyl carrier protein subunit [Gracilimonas mengyeensis]SMO67224.1 Biotin-requiring enzyme [Gracilimonas mengyeensis]
MKKYQFEINGNNYDVKIRTFEDNVVDLEVNGTPYKVNLKQEVKTKKTPRLVRSKTPPPSTKDNKPLTRGGKLSTIKAPLPGKILTVLVKEGDTVSKDQKLIVMEAMKMENNIQSDTDGVIKSIKVSPGSAVLQDDILLEIE